MQLTVSGGTVAGNPSLMSEHFLQKFGVFNRPNETEAVPCEPLSGLIASAGMRHINIFTLDVEGAELEVLHTLDWGQVTFDVLMVEVDGHLHGALDRDDAVRTELSSPKAGLCRLPTADEWKVHRLPQTPQSPGSTAHR
jgi:hypothetical protein